MFFGGESVGFANVVAAVVVGIVVVGFRFEFESVKEKKIKRRKTETRNGLPKSNCLFDNQMHSIIELYIYVITMDFFFPQLCVVPVHLFSEFFFYVLLVQSISLFD